MKNLYLAGIELEKRKEFNAIVEELKNHKEVYIVDLPEEYNIVEMEYTNSYNRERRETGYNFTSYDYCYVTFLYRGKLVYIQASSYYPFTDTNNPGKWNYIIYDVVGLNRKVQCTYYIKYAGVDNIKVNAREINKVNNQYIDPLKNNYMVEVKNIVAKDGGYREKEVIKAAIIEKTETWNDEHKVVNVLSVNMDEDGYMQGFAVDLVTKSICG